MSKKPRSYVLSIVADEDTHKRLQKVAQAELRSKSTMGLLLLQEALENRLKAERYPIAISQETRNNCVA